MKINPVKHTKLLLWLWFILIKTVFIELTSLTFCLPLPTALSYEQSMCYVPLKHLMNVHSPSNYLLVLYWVGARANTNAVHTCSQF